VHRLLVAGRKADRIQRVGLRQRERLAKRVEHVRARRGAHLADRRVGQVEERPPQQRRAALGHRIGAGHLGQPELDAGVLGAARQHPRLADDDGRHARIELFARYQLRDQLRADPARIPEEQTDAHRSRHGWPPVAAVVRWLPATVSPPVHGLHSTIPALVLDLSIIWMPSGTLGKRSGSGP
jgi:hypothetical protein